MAQTSKREVRIVVQHTKQLNGWSYRLIAYEDSRTYVPLNFKTRDDLVRALRVVVSDFAESDLTNIVGAGHSYVAFSTDLQLNDGHLFLLGLNPASGSWQ